MAKYKKVFIAEKPSLAKAIANALGGEQTRGDGFILVGGDIAVTNCFGHMLELAPPAEYNPEHKVWNVDHLPYAPAVWKLLPKANSVDQLNKIAALLKQTDCVVNAGDPDREGQMLVDEIMEYYNWTGKTERILPNATDLVSMKMALSSIKDNALFVNLFKSAKCRSRADWIVGLSLTVAATKLLSKDNLISLGRVQSPTLYLIVLRDLEIETFVSKEFFTLKAQVKTSGIVLEMTHAPQDDTRIFAESVAKDIANSIKNKTFPLNVAETDASESPFFPFTLESLQKEAGDFLGMNSADVLKTAQSLYDGQYTSYPRTDCPYIPSEQKGQAISIANAVIGAGYFMESKPFSALFAPSNVIYNTKKAPVHHAIIPTSKIPSGLSGNDLAVYNLIVKRFILSLMPSYKFKETRVTFTHNGREFSAKGEVPVNLEQSWRALSRKSNAPVALPVIQDKSDGLVESASVHKGKTTAPIPFTEADLFAEMSNIGKYVDDPKIKAILKESSGIGTVATKVAILATLKQRGYIEVIKKGKKEILRSTAFGREVIAAIPKQLKDPGMTAVWEEALKSIADGTYDADLFMTKIVAFTSRRIEEMKVSGLKVTATPVVPTLQSKPFSPRQGTSSSSHSRKAPQSKASPQGGAHAKR